MFPFSPSATYRLLPNGFRLIKLLQEQMAREEEERKAVLEEKEKQAAMLAAAQSLPVPTFKLRDSERAKWMVDLRDLAEHIDNKRRQALNDYTEVNAI